MKQYEIKIFSTISILLGTIIWAILISYNDVKFFSLSGLKYLNISIGLTSIFWTVYFKWAWKWKYAKSLLYKPNLNGTWLGEFSSDWKNNEGNALPPGKFVLVIRQHWFSISIRAFTEKQKTESYVETLFLDNSKGTKILAYLFSEKQIGHNEHSVRQGAAELDLSETNSYKTLDGNFWTRAGTRGYIKVKQASCKIHVDSFQYSKELWPKEESWGKCQ